MRSRVLPSTLFPSRAVGVRPLCFKCRPYSGGGDPFQMRPRAALLSCFELAGAAAEREAGFAKAACRAAVTRGQPRCRRRASLPVFSPCRSRQSRRAEERATSGIHPQGPRSAVLEGATRRWGSNGPAFACRGLELVVAVA